VEQARSRLIGFEACFESQAILPISITPWSLKGKALMVPLTEVLPRSAKLLIRREIEEMTRRLEDHSASMLMLAVWQSAHGLARQITRRHERGLQTARAVFRLSLARRWSH
jgi:hypothetical protein